MCVCVREREREDEESEHIRSWHEGSIFHTHADICGNGRTDHTEGTVKKTREREHVCVREREREREREKGKIEDVKREGWKEGGREASISIYLRFLPFSSRWPSFKEYSIAHRKWKRT